MMNLKKGLKMSSKEENTPTEFILSDADGKYMYETPESNGFYLFGDEEKRALKFTSIFDAKIACKKHVFHFPELECKIEQLKQER